MQYFRSYVLLDNTFYQYLVLIIRDSSSVIYLSAEELYHFIRNFCVFIE